MDIVYTAPFEAFMCIIRSRSGKYSLEVKSVMKCIFTQQLCAGGPKYTGCEKGMVLICKQYGKKTEPPAAGARNEANPYGFRRNTDIHRIMLR
jgi:hypothetical protein